MYSKVSQLHIDIYPLFFRFFSHIDHYKVLSRVKKKSSAASQYASFCQIRRAKYSIMLFFLTWLLGGLELCTVYKSDWFLSLQLFWHISLHIRVLALLMLKQGHRQEFDEDLGKVKGSQ